MITIQPPTTRPGAAQFPPDMVPLRPLPFAALAAAGVRHQRGEGAATALVTADAAAHAELWTAYRDGLAATYAAMGVGHLAPDPGAPQVATTVTLALDASGNVVGGSRLRAGSDLPAWPRLGFLAPAFAEHAAEGLNELSGAWVHPAARGRGLAEVMYRVLMAEAARSCDRWTVGFPNQFNLNSVLRVGFTVDDRFPPLAVPTPAFRSTLVWFDHERDVRRQAA